MEKVGVVPSSPLCQNILFILLSSQQRQIQRGTKGLEPRSDFKLPNFLKIEIIGFCLKTSLHKSNFHANHAHHAYHAQNWSVEPLSDLSLDPPLSGASKRLSKWNSLVTSAVKRNEISYFIRKVGDQCPPGPLVFDAPESWYSCPYFYNLVGLIPFCLMGREEWVFYINSYFLIRIEIFVL